VTARAGDDKPIVTVKAASCRNLNVDFTIKPFQSARPVERQQRFARPTFSLDALSSRRPVIQVRDSFHLKTL
jgi:hypothetical protein